MICHALFVLNKNQFHLSLHMDLKYSLHTNMKHCLMYEWSVEPLSCLQMWLVCGSRAVFLCFFVALLLRLQVCCCAHIFFTPCIFVLLCCCLSSGEGFWFFRGGACSNFGSFSFGFGFFVSLLLGTSCTNSLPFV
jgi:hypothetical protein